MQDIYWIKMYRYKYSIYYLREQLQMMISVNRSIKIVCAVASSASIAAWAKWNGAAFWWGLVIVISQVISAMVEILPFKERISELSNMLAILSNLYINIEKDWYRVASGELNSGEINELVYSYEEQWDRIDSKYFVKDVIPRKDKFRDIAEEQANEYFKSTFRED